MRDPRPRAVFQIEKESPMNIASWQCIAAACGQTTTACIVI
jgi:hypothetical protein